VPDLGSTTFGYIIAYLLPGLTASIGLAFLSSPVEKVFRDVIGEQNFALGLMGALAAIALGLFLTLFRALIVEELLWRSWRLSPDEHAELITDEDSFRAYRSTVDEIYRYHQFWGGMALALPVVVVGIVYQSDTTLRQPMDFLLLAGLVAVECGTLWATWTSYRRYTDRVKLLLKK
jgi:hypothetical protein